MDHKSEVPAWMLCEDIITRIKDELVLEAIDIVHENMDAGRMDISGYVPLLPDKPNEMQRDMFIINNLIEKENEIADKYRPYIEEKNVSDPAKLKRIEELRKFMLSLSAISMLMRFSKVAESWSNDIGMHSAVNDMKSIIVKTLAAADERMEILGYVLSSSRFARSEALKKNELAILKEALEAAKSKALH